MVEATRLAPYALSTVAVDTIADVTNNAITRIGGREDQVGFDIGQFLQNIRDPGPLEVAGGRGTVGILDTTKMGTVEDFEEIAGVRGLWHEGNRAGLAFKLGVFDDPEIRDELARDRRAIWGTRTPQWYLLENGTSGLVGAYPQAPPTHFIASATRSDRMTLRLRNAMSHLFRGIARS